MAIPLELYTLTLHFTLSVFISVDEVENNTEIHTYKIVVLSSKLYLHIATHSSFTLSLSHISTPQWYFNGEIKRCYTYKIVVLSSKLYLHIATHSSFTLSLFHISTPQWYFNGEIKRC
jgi:hypothetical protein